jgi:hypothetical protein
MAHSISKEQASLSYAHTWYQVSCGSHPLYTSHKVHRETVTGLSSAYGALDPIRVNEIDIQVSAAFLSSLAYVSGLYSGD